ncbi:hypothetical protein LJK88_10825 [Paenibacillus sp. P26]|nr:hypothetical protein LJK88_10825 [Paenibacillus sp. P26]
MRPRTIISSRSDRRLLYDALTCPKTLMRFTTEDSAEEHCQFGALLFCNQRMFEWLDETLGIN